MMTILKRLGFALVVTTLCFTAFLTGEKLTLGLISS